MSEYAVWVMGIFSFTVLSLALLAYWFDWSKLRAEPSKDVTRRVDAYQDDVASLRRSTGSSLDELGSSLVEFKRQLQRLTHTTEAQSERFDVQLQRMIEERERYAALAADPGSRIGGMRRA